MKNHVTLLLFLSIILACSTDDNLTESETTEQEFVKSRTFTNLPSDAPNYNEFYSYNNGLLMSASGFTHLLGEYSYDDNENLNSIINEYEHYTYEYDNQRRIIKRNEVGTNNYIQLFFEDDRVITKRYYEFGGTNGVPNSHLEERELSLDNKGRIIKMTDLAPDESAIDLDYEIYEYDDRGNIIKITSKPTGQDGERVLNYTYGNIKNSYHYSFKKYYESAYYISFFLGVNQRNDYGLNPNLVNSENRSYEVNEFNYPIKETKSSDSEPTIIVYEYY